MFYDPLYEPHDRGRPGGMGAVDRDDAPPGLPSLGSVRNLAGSMAALMG